MASVREHAFCYYSLQMKLTSIPRLCMNYSINSSPCQPKVSTFTCTELTLSDNNLHVMIQQGELLRSLKCCLSCIELGDVVYYKNSILVVLFGLNSK